MELTRNDRRDLPLVLMLFSFLRSSRFSVTALAAYASSESSDA